MTPPLAQARLSSAPSGALRRLRVLTDPSALAALRQGSELLRRPAWSDGDAGWVPSAVAWCEQSDPVDPAGEQVVGAVLVLRRCVPGSSRFLAWLPRRPQLPAGMAAEPLAWLPPVAAALRAEGAFAVRLRPAPLPGLLPAARPQG